MLYDTIMTKNFGTNFSKRKNFGNVSRPGVRKRPKGQGCDEGGKRKNLVKVLEKWGEYLVRFLRHLVLILSQPNSARPNPPPGNPPSVLIPPPGYMTPGSVPPETICHQMPNIPVVITTTRWDHEISHGKSIYSCEFAAIF